MWICPECETKNKNSIQICPCCGTKHKSEETPKAGSQFSNKNWEYFDTSQSDPTEDQTVHSNTKQQPSLKEKLQGTIWPPLLIYTIWIFILNLKDYSEAGNILIRIQNGDHYTLFYLVSPLIATLLICVKTIPESLKIIGAFFLGFLMFYSSMYLFGLVLDYFNWNVIFSGIFLISYLIISIYIGFFATSMCLEDEK